MNKEVKYYVARRQDNGSIAAMIDDNGLLFDKDREAILKKCMEAGLILEQMTQKEITDILTAQFGCESHEDKSDKFHFERKNYHAWFSK